MSRAVVKELFNPTARTSGLIGEDLPTVSPICAFTSRAVKVAVAGKLCAAVHVRQRRSPRRFRSLHGARLHHPRRSGARLPLQAAIKKLAGRRSSASSSANLKDRSFLGSWQRARAPTIVTSFKTYQRSVQGLWQGDSPRHRSACRPGDDIVECWCGDLCKAKRELAGGAIHGIEVV